ncbi:MAG: hypothetical protein WBA74_23530 [Cyclobacteriaceae bacterium]
MKQFFVWQMLICLLVAACGETDGNEVYSDGNASEGLTVDVPERSGKVKLKKNSYAIGDSITHTDLRNFKYFGTFFKGRASYFHNHKDTLFHGKDIIGRDLLICFFDNQIARLKYNLDTDISSLLMKKYGSFKMRPLDSLSRTVVKTGKVIIKENDSVSINRKIRNYELTWTRADKQIVFKRAQGFGAHNSYIYEERIPDYKSSMVYLTRF